MTGRPTVLGIIPARGGSKGLPNKNILPLAGKPLIAHTIAAALAARLLDKVIVSTDHEGIAEKARQYGADVPFIRPSELAQDDTAIYPVLAHAVRWLEQHEGYSPDYVMLLQPTSPLRNTEDIDSAVRLALEKDADGVVSLSSLKHHPYWTKGVSTDGRIVDFIPLDSPLEVSYNRRQDLPEAYALNGAIYLVRRPVLLEKQTFYTDRTYAYIMPPERSIDVDSSWDLHIAELILRDGKTETGI